MKEKFIVETINEDGDVVSAVPYKTMRKIAETLKVEYHDARTIYYMSEGKQIKKYLHPNLSRLYKKYRIKDNQELLNF